MKRILMTMLGFILAWNLVAQVKEPKEFQKLRYVNYAIDQFYVDSVDRNKLVESAIISMLEELDPHSTYLNVEEVKEANEPLEGNFDGIGVQFNMLNDTLFIINVISGGPAERVGVQAGDRIITVNDSLIAGVKLSTQGIMKLLRGPKGTKVNIGVKRRNNPELIQFRITRDQIPIHSLEAAYMADKNTGYIRISRFAATTYNEMKEALATLHKQGMQDLILDLEGNGGGYLGEAINMANEFLDAGQLIVYTEGKQQPRQDAYSDRKGAMKDTPLVILVDESSASASEIVSGAIQDLDRGVIVGRRTFGKGLVQRPIPLPDGSMIRLTVARYYTPSGRSIQRPYGEGSEQYHQDLINRYNSGEMNSADSIHFPDSLRYTTLHTQRAVYGGGGIMPDVFVPVDTTQYSKEHVKLVANGIILKFVTQYFDQHQAKLHKEYKNFNAFQKNFKVTQQMLDQLLALASKEEIKIDTEALAPSINLIKLQLKALIARDLYDMSAYYQVMNSQNPTYNEALKVINDPKRYRQILSKQL